MATNESTDPHDWASFFADRAELLRQRCWAPVAREARSLLLPPYEHQRAASLARYVRALGRAQVAGPDPWRIEAALRVAGLGALGRMPSAALDRRQGQGVLEPALELRALAIARRLLDALCQASTPQEASLAAAPELDKVAGVDLVFWYLTDTNPPLRHQGDEWRALAEAAAAVHGVSGPLGPLSPEELLRRAQQVYSWASSPANEQRARSDLLLARFCKERESWWRWVQDARAICVAELKGDHARASREAVALLGQVLEERSRGDPVVSFGSRCAGAYALGLLSAMHLGDATCDAYARELARRLVEALPGRLEALRDEPSLQRRARDPLRGELRLRHDEQEGVRHRIVFAEQAKRLVEHLVW